MEFKLPLKILAVDPATTKSGWSILLVESLYPLTVRVLDRGEVDGAKLLKKRKEMMLTFQKQFCLLDVLYETYVDIIKEHNPDEIISEGSFGYKHMSALIALTLAIHTLRRAAANTICKDIYEIPPTISKKSFTGKGNADKDQMREAYEEADYIVKTINRDISEHEIDSISHGVAFIRVYITKEVVQNHAKDKK